MLITISKTEKNINVHKTTTSKYANVFFQGDESKPEKEERRRSKRSEEEKRSSRRSRDPEEISEKSKTRETEEHSENYKSSRQLNREKTIDIEKPLTASSGRKSAIPVPVHSASLSSRQPPQPPRQTEAEELATSQLPAELEEEKTREIDNSPEVVSSYPQDNEEDIQGDYATLAF